MDMNRLLTILRSKEKKMKKTLLIVLMALFVMAGCAGVKDAPPAPISGVLRGPANSNFPTYDPSTQKLYVPATGSLFSPVSISAKSGAYTVGTDDTNEHYGTYFFATGAADLTLDAKAGAFGCLSQGQGNTSALTINPGTGNYFVVNGARATAGTDFVSSGDAEDKICWICRDGTDIHVVQKTGEWGE
jgi:hypothetical protein